MFYLAYGMNSNTNQMSNRCPKAMSFGRYDLKDHRIVFRGVADIEVSEGSVAQCVLWDITPECEVELDFLEGYPFFYDKKYVTISTNGREYEAMFYQMTEGHVNYYPPNTYYQQMLEEGYSEHGLELDQIYTAEGFTYDDLWMEEYANG